jgi:isopenicillin N synthase-like dioxygenase
MTFDLYAPSPYPSHGAPLESQARPRPRLLEGKNPFPCYPADFESVIESWTSKMKVLGIAVMTAMAHGLGLDPKEGGELLKTMEDFFWCMRLIGSFPLPGACL